MEQQWLLIITDFWHTYINKFIKAYLSIFISVTIQHEFLNNFSHFISGQWHISFFEKLMKFIVTNESIAVEINFCKGFFEFIKLIFGNLGGRHLIHVKM